MHERAETWSEADPEGRWRCFDYDELLKRDKLSLDLFWIKDKSLTDTDALPAPDIIAAEIADDLEAALEQFTKIAARLSPRQPSETPEGGVLRNRGVRP
jgi:type I restriction enzyme M protein